MKKITVIAATMIAAFFSAGCGRNAQQRHQNAGAEYASMTIAPVSVSLSAVISLYRALGGGVR